MRTIKCKTTEEGMKLDLGGIAKGFAADEVAKVLSQVVLKKQLLTLVVMFW